MRTRRICAPALIEWVLICFIFRAALFVCATREGSCEFRGFEAPAFSLQVHTSGSSTTRCNISRQNDEVRTLEVVLKVNHILELGPGDTIRIQTPLNYAAFAQSSCPGSECVRQSRDALSIGINSSVTALRGKFGYVGELPLHGQSLATMDCFHDNTLAPLKPDVANTAYACFDTVSGTSNVKSGSECQETDQSKEKDKWRRDAGHELSEIIAALCILLICVIRLASC